MSVITHSGVETDWKLVSIYMYRLALIIMKSEPATMIELQTSQLTII